MTGRGGGGRPVQGLPGLRALRGSARPPRPIRALLALLLAAAVTAVPVGGHDVRAATPDLTLVAATTYEVHPDEGRVAITATVTATNHLKDTLTRRYFFEGALLAVLPGTTNFTITAATGTPTVAVSGRSESGVVLRLGFGSRLAAGQSLVMTLTYELVDPGGAPDRALRISPSIVVFQAWASATNETPGSSVEVRIPTGYTTSVGRGPLTGPVDDGTGWQVYSSGSLSTPLTFVADITADSPGEYVDRHRSTTAGGDTVIVVFRAWPDDAAWRDRVSDIVLRSLPVLADDIGAPWSYEAPLTVQETLIRPTGGFEGAFDPEAVVMDVGYTARPGVILHQAAHAWFNGNLVAERWIAEAFAAWYAERAATTLDLAIDSPDFTGLPVEDAFPLNEWRPAGVATPSEDAYGNAASLALARATAGVVGDDALRQAWRAATAGLPAYQPGTSTAPIAQPGDATGQPAEGGAAPPDWRALLDLLETGATADQIDDLEGLWRRWVIRPADAEVLDTRLATRRMYDEAVSTAAPWTLPRPIRDAMRAWQFGAASGLMNEAAAVIRQRAAIETASAGLALTPPAALRVAFEGAASLSAASAEAAAELGAIGAIGAAQATRIQSPSLVDRLGLLGADPGADLARARAAFEAGDLDTTLSAAAAARAAWTAAPTVARGRMISGVLLAVALTLFAWLVAQQRRRRARKRLEHARPMDQPRR